GFPGPLGKIVPVADLVAAAVRGIERRAPRIIYPRLYLGWAWYRGLINPIIDFGIDHHRKVQRLLRELESRTIDRG
ncbi:MAG: hypothetical protein Q7T55_17930, partial [Solirubrobacteraceae bacterium]|nr:hypothetical protein [Solirubrobacteraceae bacterium]